MLSLLVLASILAIGGIPGWFLAVCAAVALACVFLSKDWRVPVAIVCAILIVLLL